MVRCYVAAKEAGTIKEIQERKDLTLVTDSQDVEEIKEYFGKRPAVKEFDGFFVKIDKGDFVEVYGFHGIVPNVEKSLFKIERKCSS